MKLLFDVGNSSINWAWAKHDQFIESGRFNYKSHTLVEQLEQHVPIQNKEEISNILVSNVAADEVLQSIQNWIYQHQQIELWQATVNTVFEELKNAYPDPEQMGVDRWLAMIVAWNKYKTDLCIVDCGTALTIDVIEQSGQHLGGYIIPGIALMQDSLIEKTKRINVSIERNFSSRLADNTQAAINHGACLAVISVINQVVRQMENDLGRLPVCLITGGIADKICKELDFSFRHEPNLVLEGLLLSHNKSR